MKTEQARESSLSALSEFDKAKLKRAETEEKNSLPSTEAIAQELEHIKFKVLIQSVFTIKTDFNNSGWNWEIWQVPADTYRDHGEEHLANKRGDWDGEICIIRIGIEILNKKLLFCKCIYIVISNNFDLKSTWHELTI